jgi:hypothetical protein
MRPGARDAAPAGLAAAVESGSTAECRVKVSSTEAGGC